MPTRGSMGMPHRREDWDAMMDDRAHKATEEYIQKRDSIPHFSSGKERKMTTIDLSLKNDRLYAGCEIEEVAGRLNLKTPVAEAVNIVGRNIAAIVEGITAAERGEVTLTGPMAVWAYLVVFHAVVHRFGKVYYDDGRSGTVLVAAHG